MPRQTTPSEVIRFSGGLITDGNPLNSPNGYMLDAQNLVLNYDGSVSRRLGMDYDSGSSPTSTTAILSDDLAISTFRWGNAGGNAAKALLVVQVGRQLKFFDLDVKPLSAGQIFSFSNSTWPTNLTYSFAVIDGLLVVANNSPSISVFTYSNGTITQSTQNLEIRDLFGVQDIINGIDLYADNSVSTRPSSSTSSHIYNLRNQSWGIAHIDGNQNGTPWASDPIVTFYNFALDGHGKYSRLPSNADTVITGLYADATNNDDPIVQRFFANDVISNPLGTFKAAQGYFIIDALARGTSRYNACVANQSKYSLDYHISTLPTDLTPGGATVVCEYAGRMWYGGFSGQITGGDSLSPRMSSYLLFSQVVDTTADIGHCYQAGDPTSKDNADIVDTDGGFIRINEAYGIQKMVSLGDSLFVLANNGVWRISGGTTKGFTATAYVVDKVTTRGCTVASNVVILDEALMYWSTDGIYYLHTNQYGDWVSENISFGIIQNLIDNILPYGKASVSGFYDNYEQKVHWLYNNNINDSNPTMELVFDVRLKAFYTHTISQLTGSIYPKPVAIYVGNPYQITEEPEDVVVGSSTVVVGSSTVTVGVETILDQKLKELGYIVITSASDTVHYNFGFYNVDDWHDWKSVDGTGVDAEAYTVTTYDTISYYEQGSYTRYTPDFQRIKQVPWLSIHTANTTDQSCWFQVRWDWTSDANSGRWSTPQQGYRAPRQPTMYLTSVSKNVVRGHGKVFSIKFYSEENKDMTLYGWSLIMLMNNNV